MKTRRLLVAFYERADREAYRWILKSPVFGRGWKIKCLSGYSYNNVLRRKARDPRAWTVKRCQTLLPVKSSGGLAGYLFGRKRLCPETRILLHAAFRKLDLLRAAIKRFKPDRILIPEDTQPAKGRLAARYLRSRGRQVHVGLPLYYEWIQSVPARGPRLAHRWYVPGRKYVKRLEGIHSHSRRIVRMSTDRHLGGSGRQVERSGMKPVFAVALQAKGDFDDMMMDLLRDTWRLYRPLRFLVGFHPSQTSLSRESIRKRFKEPCFSFVSGRRSIQEFMGFSAGLLTQSSMSALQAMKIGLPVILVSLTSLPHETGLTSPQGVSKIPEAGDPQRLACLLEGFCRPGFVHQTLTRQDRLLNRSFAGA